MLNFMKKAAFFCGAATITLMSSSAEAKTEFCKEWNYHTVCGKKTITKQAYSVCTKRRWGRCKRYATRYRDVETCGSNVEVKKDCKASATSELNAYITATKVSDRKEGKYCAEYSKTTAACAQYVNNTYQESYRTCVRYSWGFCTKRATKYRDVTKRECNANMNVGKTCKTWSSQ